MNKLLTTLILILFFSGSDVFAQVEYKIVTTVESIVPLGAGRSRMISSDDLEIFLNLPQRELKTTRSETSLNVEILGLKILMKLSS